MPDWILKYWVEALFGGIIAVLTSCYRSLTKRLKEKEELEKKMEKEHKEQDEALKSAVMAILHDRLYQAGSHFIAKGEISLGELKNIEYLYNSYHALGGNGTGTEIYSRVKDLPLKDD